MTGYLFVRFFGAYLLGRDVIHAPSSSDLFSRLELERRHIFYVRILGPSGQSPGPLSSFLPN